MYIHVLLLSSPTCHTHNVFPHAFLPAAVPSVVVNFNDTRCAEGGRVCPTDSLLFTCTTSEITILRVSLPSGHELTVTSSGIVIGNVPDGFSVEPPIVAVNGDGTSFNYTLSLSIENASLLAGDVIVCDDGGSVTRDMAGCPTVGKFYNHSFMHNSYIGIIIMDIYILLEVDSFKVASQHNLDTCR